MTAATITRTPITIPATATPLDVLPVPTYHVAGRPPGDPAETSPRAREVANLAPMSGLMLLRPWSRP